MHESLLIYRNLRYLKISMMLIIISGIMYFIHDPIGEPNGGTWLGYVLGTLSALIMLWLTWFGVRKRAYASSEQGLQGWASAHVYLGLALIVLSTLHSGFQFGMNIHTLLYVLMMIVIISGIVGLYFYLVYPSLITENRRGLTTEMMVSQIAEIDSEIRKSSLNNELNDKTLAILNEAINKTSIGGNIIRQVLGNDPRCPTTKARIFLESEDNQDNPSSFREILSKVSKKEELLKRIRTDIKYRALLQLWLHIHVPFTFASLAALAAHVLSVFYYW